MQLSWRQRNESCVFLGGVTHHGICRAVDPMPRFQEVVNLDADALREAAEYLQLQYRKLHESEAYLAPGEWERRPRLVTIKVTDFEFEALSSLAEVTGLTKSRLMRLALAGKAHEPGRGAVKVPRAAPESDDREHRRERSLRPGRAVFT